MTEPRPLRLNYLLRDSNQSLIGGRERIDRNVEKAELAAQAGFAGIEIWGGTQLEIPARFKNEHPFEQGLRPLAQAASGVERLMLMRGQAGNGRRLYSDEAIRLEMDVITRDDQITTVRAFDATNNFENLRTVFEAKKELAAEGRPVKLQAAMSYALSVKSHGDEEGWTYRDPQFYVDLADRYIAAGADEICFKDMAGVMKSSDAAFMISAIKAKHPAIPLTLHMHASGGQAQATMLAAIKAGIDTVDVSVEGMGDWVGHPTAEDILWLMGNSEDQEIISRMPEIDREALARLKEHNLETRMLYRSFELAYDPEIQKAIVRAGLPGGMATTLLNNIAELYQNKASQDELKIAMLGALNLIPVVTEDLGHLEKVTPTSDIVGKQAVYNWFYFQKGQEPYAVLAPGFADYVLGKNGYSQNKPREKIIAMVEAKTGKLRYAGRPADAAPTDEIARTRSRLLDLGLEPSDENVLTALMSGDDGVGFSFLESYAGRTPAKPYRPESIPQAVPYYADNMSSRPGYLGPAEEKRVLGMAAEEIIQKAQKLQMIEDGASFSGLPSGLKKKYIETLKLDIEQGMAAIPQKLRDAGYNETQILVRIFSHSTGKGDIQSYWHQRARELGVRPEYVPSMDVNPRYRPAQNSALDQGDHDDIALVA